MTYDTSPEVTLPARRVVLARHCPDTGSTAGVVRPGSAALAYRELGWPVTVHGDQVSLNLDLDVDAVALVIPILLAGEVAEILTRRRCPPPVLAHPALPPTATTYGPICWVHPPQRHALKLCREFDVRAALSTALPDPRLC